MFRVSECYSVRKILSALFFLLASGVFASDYNNSPDLRKASPSADKTSVIAFQQAINDDLAGHHREARRKYDQLKDSTLMKATAVPSAVNLVALGRYKEAHQAFSLLQQHGNGRERDYALLWDLWLTARTWHGSKSELENKLADKTANYMWFSTYESAIASIYVGKGSAEDVFNLIEGISFARGEEKSDAITQAVFFVGGYYRYVINDPHQAEELYKKYQSRFNNQSLELRLIMKEQKSLFLSE